VRELSRIGQVRDALRSARREGRTIALVPTMGALHDGHLRLVDHARGLCDDVVMSVFVNPLQFGASEDFGRYPRDPEGDRRLAAERGVDLLFVPLAEEMYPHERVVTVSGGAVAERWEGAARPGHFAGVLTVVAKLFNIVEPDVAVFGQKDVQQATLIRAMVRDLDFPVAIEVVPTVRDPDGLAMSSRNRYLSPDERLRALAIPRALEAIIDAWKDGDDDAEQLMAIGTGVLRDAGVQAEYLAIMAPDTLEAVSLAEPGTIVAIAARVGSTRLIDNVILERP
jgi:pantoate--beta-alanine ligase